MGFNSSPDAEDARIARVLSEGERVSTTLGAVVVPSVVLTMLRGGASLEQAHTVWSLIFSGGNLVKLTALLEVKARMEDARLQ